MKINHIQINNFTSFQLIKNSFPIGDYSGLTLVEGNNKDNPGAISNGAGKTSAFEALCWGLYGKTFKGLTGDDVVNDIKNKNCCVVIELTDDKNTLHTISRYRKHEKFNNQVILISNTKKFEGGTKETQEEINKILGLDYQTFIFSIYIPQEFYSLLDMRNAERIELTSKVMGLGIYDEAKKITQEKTKALNFINQKLNQEREKLSAILTEIQATDYTIKSKEFEKDRNEKINTFITVKAELVKQVDEVKKTIELQKTKTKDKINKLNIEISKISLNDLAKYDDIKNILAELNKEAGTLNEKLIIIQNNYFNSSNLIKKFNSLENKCPTCEKDIEEEYKNSIIDNIKKEQKEFNEIIQKYTIELGAIKEKINKNETNKTYLEGESVKLTTLMVEKEKLENDVKNPLLNELQIKIDHVQETIVANEKEINPYEEQISIQKTKIKELKNKIIPIGVNIFTNNKKIAILTDLEEIFSNKGIKCTLLENIIELFEERTNHYLDTLAFNTVSIKYRTNKLLKSGDTVSAFNVLVIEDGKEKIYEKYSGGEKQRIRIAVTLAMSDLILSRFDKIYDLVIFDECDQNLDDLGIDKLFEAFSKLNKNAFLITQRTGLKDKFEQVITVKKENGISELIL